MPEVAHREQPLQRLGRRAGYLGLILLVCAVLGATSQPITDPLWQKQRKHEPILQVQEIEDAMGHGILLALVGGFRSLVADFFWMKMHFAWEKKKLVETEALIWLTASVDPTTPYFFDNGSRVLALDMNYWRIDRLEDPPESVKEVIDREQGQKGIDLLNRGLQYHPNNGQLYIEKAQIYQLRMDDKEEAAELYWKALQTGKYRLYAPRVYARLLMDTNQHQRAYDYLRELYPTLPEPEEEIAWQKETVYEMIEVLEETLAVPAAQRVPK